MPRDRSTPAASPDAAISIIAAGMSVEGDCATDGSLRIEGRVTGTVSAGKAVVIGKDGVVDGHVVTQDAVISGRVTGTVTADSRLEVQASARIDGEVHARRMQLEEGAELNGRLSMGDRFSGPEDGGQASSLSVHDAADAGNVADSA